MEIIHDAHTTYLIEHRLDLADPHVVQHATISVGLLIETHARIFERVRGTVFDERDQSLCADALRNVLDALGVRDRVLIEYAHQIEVRRLSGSLPRSGAISEESVKTAPSVGLASWHSRIDDAAALAEREGVELPVALSSDASEPDRETLGRDSAHESQQVGKSPSELLEPDEWPGAANVMLGVVFGEGYKSPEEIQADRAEADADAGTQGEE